MHRTMKNLFSTQTLFSLFGMIFFSLLPCLAAASNTIGGSVHNASTGAPAAGDAVVLLRLLDGMQEEAHARTDAQGGFSFNVQFPGTRYLVRVVHQDVNYDQEISVGSTASMDVFDAVSKVKGISGRIEIIRIGSHANSLHISDMYDIKNESNPPQTQVGDRNFEVYLPAKAKIESVLAAGPTGAGVKIPVAQLNGEPGHYTINFPLRPGETKFAVNYDLPYTGQADFHPRLLYPVQQLAVMLSPSMTFRSSSPGFHSIVSNNDVQVQAVNQVEAGVAPSFEISGNGVLPPLNVATKTSANAQLHPPAVTSPSTSAGNGLKTADASAPLPATAVQGTKQNQLELLMLIAGLAAMILFGIWLLRMRRNATPPAMAASGGSKTAHSSALIAGLKEELLNLETDRLRGSITSEEYTTTKQALDETVRRAITKSVAQK